MQTTEQPKTDLQRVIERIEAALASLQDGHTQLAVSLLNAAIKEMRPS